MAALEAAGLRVERSTYAFALVFPMFAAERLLRRLRRPSGTTGCPPCPRGRSGCSARLCAAEARLLARRDLPFGSSVLVAAVKP